MSDHDQFAMLVTSAGRRVGLIECFRNAAKTLGCKLTVIATDIKPDLSAACRIADKAIAVPSVTDDNYSDSILGISSENRCRLLVPTIDTELGIIASLREQLAAIGVRAIVSDVETVAIARDKAATADVLAKKGIRTPRTAHPTDVLRDEAKWRWPVFIKPRDGSSSKDITVISSAQGLRAHEFNQKMIVQERLYGAEYTVNVFVDQNGRLRCAVPHQRIEVRAGEVSKGRTERVPALEQYAALLTEALPGARGPLCFQAFVDRTGTATVFEVNARFGGGYPLADYAGARFAQWLLEEILDLASSANNNWRSGVSMLRYDAAVYYG